eukprot:scaffold2045_cov404-Prasinococcus_capsulatus_cf.AAC.12
MGVALPQKYTLRCRYAATEALRIQPLVVAYSTTSTNLCPATKPKARPHCCIPSETRDNGKAVLRRNYLALFQNVDAFKFACTVGEGIVTLLVVLVSGAEGAQLRLEVLPEKRYRRGRSHHQPAVDICVGLHCRTGAATRAEAVVKLHSGVYTPGACVLTHPCLALEPPPHGRQHPAHAGIARCARCHHGGGHPVLCGPTT